MRDLNRKLSSDVLFWSGGKDSYLALRYLQDDTNRDPILLTTYDDETGIIPHQNIPLEVVQKQAIDLELILFTVPISYPASNQRYLQAIGESLKQIPFSIDHLVFGDLHLHDIRAWREKQFGEMGFKLLFPIWEKPYKDLMDRLDSENITVRISSVAEEFSQLIKPDVMLDREFTNSLPDEIDKMGERGEFHTQVVFT